jgi:valyl-tRNA synthetase
MRLSMQLVESSRNFVNKLWNATRFALTSIRSQSIALDDEGPVRPAGDLALADRWIISRLDDVAANVRSLLSTHLYGEAGRQLREFAWSELCDWYIEAAKARLRGSDADQAAVAQTLAYVIERTLRLLHPFMPFATEALWQEMPHVGASIMIAAWPKPGTRDLTAEADFGLLMELVGKIRNARTESKVEPARWIAATVYARDRRPALEDARAELSLLARVAVDQLSFVDGEPGSSPQSIVAVAGDVVAVLPLAGMVDLDAERARLRKELDDAEGERGRINRQLVNEAFVAKAPAKVVQNLRDRLSVVNDKIGLLNARVAEIDG